MMDNMPDYTIQIDVDHSGWGDDEQLYHRSNITDERDARALADWLADQYCVKDGSDWRVRVWAGHDASPDAVPLANMGVCEYEP
jgi:hypothetical protein